MAGTVNGLDISVGARKIGQLLLTRIVGTHAEDINEAAKLVLEGGLVAYPTDTVYGLGCNPFDRHAIDRLVRAKERVKGSLPILVSTFQDAERLGYFSGLAMRLANTFWPGPLTLVVRPRMNFPLRVTGDALLVGLRIPSHEIAKRLIKECGGSLIGTSANVSGRPSLTTAKEVVNELGDRVDLVVDGGPVLLGRESTVVKVLGDESTVIREGAISREDILKTLPETRVS